MAKLNKVFLIGNLTRNPELRYTPAGKAIASFGIAMNHTWKAEGGEKKEEVCYVDINMFGKRGEVINQYFTKGDPILIEGRLQFQQWETKDGQKRNALRVVAENFEFIGNNSKSPKSKETVGAGSGNYADDVNEEEIPF